MADETDGRVTGYRTLNEYPDYPSQDIPTKADCAGYEYISMQQLCSIAKHHHKSLHAACDAFGGDNGDLPVQPDRQAWKWKQAGYRIKKFVLVRAVEDYFDIIGIDW